MGLKDRVLDVVAGLFAPATDHPARGGMTGDDAAEDEDESEGTTTPDDGSP